MRKVALITGGSRGIGLGIATQLAEEGFDLVINGVRGPEDVKESIAMLESYGGRVLYVQGNIASSSDRQRILTATLENFGHIHVLVNNAGIAPVRRIDFLEVAEEDFDYLMDINQKGTFFMSQLVAKWMVEFKNNNRDFEACMVNITSVSSEAASVLRAEYCMSKASLTMLTKILAVRMSEVGIPVYEIQPGFVDTDMISKVREKYVELSKEMVLEKRMATPQDIGTIVRSLVTGKLPYATGQIIRADGGMGIWRF